MAKKPDPNDPREAELLLKKFCPDNATRRTVIAVLAEAVIEVNAASREKWGTTIRAEFIRLNLGRVQVVTIGRDLLHLLALETSLPESVPEHWGIALGQASVPGSCGVQLEAPTVDDWALVRPAWSDAVRFAAKTPMHNMTKPYHASGVVEYLRTASSMDIPTPPWAA